MGLSHGWEMCLRQNMKVRRQQVRTLETSSFKEEELTRENEDVASGRWEASTHRIVCTIKDFYLWVKAGVV